MTLWIFTRLNAQMHSTLSDLFTLKVQSGVSKLLEVCPGFSVSFCTFEVGRAYYIDLKHWSIAMSKQFKAGLLFLKLVCPNSYSHKIIKIFLKS